MVSIRYQAGSVMASVAIYSFCVHENVFYGFLQCLAPPIDH